MQKQHEGIIRAVNNDSKSYNILTFPTHEPYQSNWAEMPHTFYLWQGQNIRTWNFNCRTLPDNHIILDGSDYQIKPNIKFDLVLSQNKFGQFGVAKYYAERFNLPLISLEHTLPVPFWGHKRWEYINNMRGDINIFITEYSMGKWGYSLDDGDTRIIRHGIDTNKFVPKSGFKNKKVLSVANDFVNRDWALGWKLHQRVTQGMPTHLVGDTKGVSKPTKNIDELVGFYQRCGVFFNSSLLSPIPTVVLEAMSCGAPVVSTATCEIPKIIEDGVNGFCSNDEEYLKEKIWWCLNNPQEAEKIGLEGRKTIETMFSMDKHVNSWMNLFDEYFGRSTSKV